MRYAIGDTVIHWTYGLGDIVQIEETTIQGQPKICYVVRTASLSIWVPVEEGQQSSLRWPTPPEEFEALFALLRSPAETLPEDRQQRREALQERLKDGRLLSICRVIRDLTHFKRQAKLNDQEKGILERATSSLLVEWAYVMRIPLAQAQRRLNQLLHEGE